MEGSKTFNTVETALRACESKYPSFAYPWDGLESFLTSTNLENLPLIGYGSLINQASAGRTINVDESAKREAVKAFGAIRVFNYRIPVEMLEKRYGTPVESKNVAALNCEVSGKSEDQFNGILTCVRPERLDSLRNREKCYSLKPVAYQGWGVERQLFQVAYILELLPSGNTVGNPYDETILPHVEYTRICQAGALAISRAFLNFFNETCFLADKQTRLFEYRLPAEARVDGRKCESD